LFAALAPPVAFHPFIRPFAPSFAHRRKMRSKQNWSNQNAVEPKYDRSKAVERKKTVEQRRGLKN